jgi:hypothetical protein
MSDFITNGAAVLPDVKIDARSPTGLTDTWDASDCNDLRQAALDLRTEAIAEVARRAAADLAESTARVIADNAIIASGVIPLDIRNGAVTVTPSVGVPMTKSIETWSGILYRGENEVLATGTTTPRSLADRRRMK